MNDEMGLLGARYDAATDRVRRVQMTRDMLLAREGDLRREIARLGEEDVVLEKVAQLFKHLIDKYVHEYAESFSAVVTEGLKAIYHDQDLSFAIEVEQKRGKVAARFVLTQGGVSGDPLQGFGGGVASVISLLLRILVLLKANKARYLLLDESLAALSDEYVEPCGEFLQKLCTDLGVHVLLVTHNAGFVDLAHTAYLGAPDAEGHLQLRRIR